MVGAQLTGDYAMATRQILTQNHMLDQSTSSDEVLLRKIADGDRQAFEALYDRHAAVAYSLIMRIVRDRALADDILQETFWQVWRRAGEYRGEGRVAAWLYRIARNRSLDEVRRLQRSPVTAAESLDAWQTDAASAGEGGRVHHPLLRRLAASRHAGDVASQFTQDQRRRHIQDALATIPPEQRTCLELAYFEGMSQQQIAEHVRLPLGTVKTRMRMGLAKLEHILRAQGYRQEDLV